MTAVLARIGRFGLWAIAASAAVILFSALLPIFFGFRPSVVVTGSMEPSISVGDTVVGHRVPPARVHVGDVVSFRDPEGSGRELTHRVISVRIGPQAVALTTKGDANTSAERFTVPASGRIGLVTYRIPKLGRALAFLRGPIARIFLIAVPALVLAVLETLRVWLVPGPTRAVGEPHAA